MFARVQPDYMLVFEQQSITNDLQ